MFMPQIPPGFSMQEAVTLPDNLVTAFHTIKSDLGLSLPWPRPNDYSPPDAGTPILIWGGSSSVGQYALQLLRYYGYRNLLTTASKKQHEYLKSIGAAAAFDYNDPDVTRSILRYAANDCGREPAVPLILDCIGSQGGSVAPIAKIAQRRAKIAVLLPIVIRDATEETAPEYSMDVQGSAVWNDGVEASGVRTHYYLNVRDVCCFSVSSVH